MDDVYRFLEILQGESGAHFALDALEIEQDCRRSRRDIGAESQEQSWATIAEADEQARFIA